MENETPNSTPVVEGTPGETGANQETPAPAQAAQESQETTTSQVETGSNQPQVTEAPRGQASNYYKEREKDRRLASEISELKRLVLEMQTPKTKNTDASGPPDFDPNFFHPEHKRILSARETALVQRMEQMEKKFEERWQQRDQVEEEQKGQGVLEKLFPKTSPDSRETLQERIDKNPERRERIRDLLIEDGYNEVARKNPDEAVRAILSKLGEGQKPTNPTVLKKTLMGANGSGSAGGGTATATEADFRSAVKKFSDQLIANPDLRRDANFMAQRAKSMSDLERLVTKK